MMRSLDGEAGGNSQAPPAGSKVSQNDDPAEAGELVQLRRESQEKDKRLKQRELRISELEDENHQLKRLRSGRAEPAKKGLEEWLFD